jgi:twitching motility protein PilT
MGQQDRNRIGDIFLECECITTEQLGIALRQQSQQGGRLGSILLDLGYVSTEELLKTLGKKYGVPTLDLLKLNIEPVVLRELPFDQIVKRKVLPVAVGVKSLFLAMVNPDDLATIEELEFALGKKIQPIAVPYAQMVQVIAYLEEHGGYPEKALNFSTVEEGHATAAQVADDAGFWALFRLMLSEGASDLLLSAGVPPCLKKNNLIVRTSNQCLTPDEVERCANLLMTDGQRQEFTATNDIDFGLTMPELGRFRVNIFKQRNTHSIAVRCVLDEIPSLESLGLPPWLKDYALKRQGLIMITGPTGHGKSTTLACLVDIINTHRQCNIITIEDPIEFLHRHKQSNVNQREIGRDTESFHRGLRRISRQAPDVIVIGEMRDPESFAIALQAAETGHLVLTTMHANFCTTAIERSIDIFPPTQQQQIRVQLAESFQLILNQRLVTRRDGNGRVVAVEKLVNSARVRNLIREGKTHHIRTLLNQTTEEFQTIDLQLAKLAVEGVIAVEEGIKFCDNPNQYRDLIARGGGSAVKQA